MKFFPVIAVDDELSGRADNALMDASVCVSRAEGG